MFGVVSLLLVKSLGNTFAWVTAVQRWTKEFIAWLTAWLPLFPVEYGEGPSKGLQVLVSLIVNMAIFGGIFGGLIAGGISTASIILDKFSGRNRLLSENMGVSSSVEFGVTLRSIDASVNNALQAALSEHIEAIETTIYQIFSLAYVGSTVTLTSERSSSMGQALILTAAALPACAPSLLVVLLTAIIAAVTKP